MNAMIEQAAEHWHFVAPLLRKPKTEADYDELVAALDQLTDLIGDDESGELRLTVSGVLLVAAMVLVFAGVRVKTTAAE